MKNLQNAKCGVYFKIVGYEEFAPLKIKRRLMELGLVAGQSVKIVRKSLLGKAYLLEVRGFLLSMRKSLSSFVVIGGKDD